MFNNIFSFIVSARLDLLASPKLSWLIIAVLALWAKPDWLSARLNEQIRVPWGQCGPTMLCGNQIRAVCLICARRQKHLADIVLPLTFLASLERLPSLIEHPMCECTMSYMMNLVPRDGWYVANYVQPLPTCQSSNRKFFILTVHYSKVKFRV